MIPGYSGALLSEFFVERQLSRTADAHRMVEAHAAMRSWRHATRVVGPATSVRALYERALTPLLRIILPGQPSDVRSTEQILVSSWQTDAAPALVMTVAWGESVTAPHVRAAIGAAGDAAAWAFLFNGTHLRVVDAEHVYSPQYAEIDLAIASEDRATFALLWTLLRAAVTPGARRSALDDLAERSRAAAIDICRALRAGVLTASGVVIAALIDRRRVPQLDAAFEQALTAIYRVLFLLFAESRGLVPMWHPVYRTSYSIDSLRAAAEHDRQAPGLWDGLRAITRLAHAGCRLGELRVAPFNGRLFAPARTPLVDRDGLDDRCAREAIVALTSTVHGGARQLIPYRDLGVEQLGGVYETLLDYEPRIAAPTGRRPRHATVTLERGSSRRKSTGSFYTPQPIAGYIVRQTLAPLVRDRDPDGILHLRIVDPAMGSGAFLVAACRFLAGCYERALIQAGDRHATDIDDQERAVIRRLIAERCLYGVDLNPMAVQLARLSLWLATLASDRPLTFLDHRLAVGNSLVGAWLSDLRQPPTWGVRARPDRSLPLFGGEPERAIAAAALPTRFRIEQIPDDTVAQVREKERALEALGRPDTTLSRWKRVGDAWCTPWFDRAAGHALTTAYAALSDGIVSGHSSLSSRTIDGLLAKVRDAAAGHRFFHWELEFPEVFFHASGGRNPSGGFDAVIGNPPWEMIRGDTGDASHRVHVRSEAGALVGFARESGVYQTRTRGHANQYQLFTERSIELARPGGRIGLVLPSGILTDVGSGGLRRRLVSGCRVDALVGFENQQAIFPIHRSVRFVLVTATRGEPTERMECRFGLKDVGILDRIGEPGERGSIPARDAIANGRDVRNPASSPLILTAEMLARISPGDLAIPDLRTPADLAIVERAATLFHPLGASAGWSCHFGRELNASDDRDALHEDGDGLPVVEGKHIEPFRVGTADVRYRITLANARRRLGADAAQRSRLCYRDVAGATNRTTLIAAILPSGCVSTHTLFCLRDRLDESAQQFLCGLFNSFVVNYLVRMRVGTHVTTEIIERLPIPTRDAAGTAYDEIAMLSRTLAKRRDAGAAARLNGIVANLYQLTDEEFSHVLSTFPLVDARDRRAALSAYPTA